MNRSTKNQLLAVVIIALIAVFVVWYLVTRQTYNQNSLLTQISYVPATGTAPYLTFTFSQPVDSSQVIGTTAVLKDFQVSSSSPTPRDVADPFIALLTQGPQVNGKAQGSAPFVPTVSAPSVLTTNTLPSGATAFTKPMVITGTGTMWFAVPKNKRQ